MARIPETIFAARGAGGSDACWEWNGWNVTKIVHANQEERCLYTSTRPARRVCTAPSGGAFNGTPTAGNVAARSHPTRPSPRTSRDTPFLVSSRATPPPPSSPRAERAIKQRTHAPIPHFVIGSDVPNNHTSVGRLRFAFDRAPSLDEGHRRLRPRLHADEDARLSRLAPQRRLRDVAAISLTMRQCREKAQCDYTQLSARALFRQPTPSGRPATVEALERLLMSY